MSIIKICIMDLPDGYIISENNLPFNRYNWHTMTDRIPEKGDVIQWLAQDGQTGTWKYGDCGFPHCRCILRGKNIKVLERE